MTDTINEIVGYDPYQMVTVMVGGRYDSTPQSIAVADITSKLARLEFLERLHEARTKEVSDLEDYLKENIDDLDEHAEEIAKIFGIELVQEVRVSLTFTVAATLEVPFGYDISEDDFQIDLSESNTDASIIDWNLDSVDCYIENSF